MTPQPSSPPQEGRGRSSPTLIIVLVLGLFGLCCLGTVGAIAVPNFLKFGSRSKQSEAKSNLKGFFAAQKSLLAEKDTYGETFTELGWVPDTSQRYAYVLSERGPAVVAGAPLTSAHRILLPDPKRFPRSPPLAALVAAIPADVRAELGVTGTCPACEATAVAVGDLDSDGTLDVWSISTRERAVDGKKVPPGVPVMHVDDTRE